MQIGERLRTPRKNASLTRAQIGHIIPPPLSRQSGLISRDASGYSLQSAVSSAALQAYAASYSSRSEWLNKSVSQSQLTDSIPFIIPNCYSFSFVCVRFFYFSAARQSSRISEVIRSTPHSISLSASSFRLQIQQLTLWLLAWTRSIISFVKIVWAMSSSSEY